MEGLCLTAAATIVPHEAINVSKNTYLPALKNKKMLKGLL